MPKNLHLIHNGVVLFGTEIEEKIMDYVYPAGTLLDKNLLRDLVEAGYLTIAKCSGGIVLHATAKGLRLTHGSVRLFKDGQ